MCLAAVDFLVARLSWPCFSPQDALRWGSEARAMSVRRTPNGETADSVVWLNTYEAGIHTIAALLPRFWIPVTRFRKHKLHRNDRLCYPLVRAALMQKFGSKSVGLSKNSNFGRL